MQKAQVSPRGIQAHSARSRMAFRMVVSTPLIFTSRATASDTMSGFPVFSVPTTALAASSMVAVSASTAGSRASPEAAATASYICAASSPAASPYFVARACARSISALVDSRSTAG